MYGGTCPNVNTLLSIIYQRLEATNVQLELRHGSGVAVDVETPIYAPKFSSTTLLESEILLPLQLVRVVCRSRRS